MSVDSTAARSSAGVDRAEAQLLRWLPTELSANGRQGTDVEASRSRSEIRRPRPSDLDLLTGFADGPPVSIAGDPEAWADATMAALDRTASVWGRPTGLDGAALLVERAALSGLTRHGRTSAGGGSRLIRAADGWMALTLSRSTDIDSIPALIREPMNSRDPWEAVESWSRHSAAEEAVERATILGLAASRLGERRCVAEPWRLSRIGDSSADRLRQPVVVNLGALWAAPLAGRLLAAAGADVVDVEFADRPDRSRVTAPEFSERLHAGHRRCVIDEKSIEGRAELRTLLADADVVIEASRPRAFRDLGIAAEQIGESARSRCWIRITGHGPDQPNRIAFGDDAAVAGGLVAEAGDGPVFAGDAIADPLTGLTAAFLASACLAADGGRWIADLAMSEVAAACVGLRSP